jgi:mannose-6-phosphate isomerase-like protein (cupin superfamily)
MKKQIAMSAIAVSLVPIAHAQALKVDHFTPDQIIAKAKELEPKAQGPDKAASTKLDEYPNHYTMVALRHKDGGAELHENFADIFYIVQGRATLVTGGSIADAKTGPVGEVRGSAVSGSAVSGGEHTTLAPGDVVHIPAGLSHQLLLKDDTFVYFVIKVKEK